MIKPKNKKTKNNGGNGKNFIAEAIGENGNQRPNRTTEIVEIINGLLALLCKNGILFVRIM